MKHVLILLKSIYLKVIIRLNRKSKKGNSDSPDQMYPLW